MQSALVFILPPVLSLLQSTLNWKGFKPSFLLVLYVFLSLKGFSKKGLFLYFSFWEAIFSFYPLYVFLIFWFILDIIISLWKKRLFLAHKSFSFVLILFLSLFSIIYWNFNSLFNLILWKRFLFLSTANLIAFLPLYIFLPKYLEKVEHEET